MQRRNTMQTMSGSKTGVGGQHTIARDGDDLTITIKKPVQWLVLGILCVAFAIPVFQLPTIFNGAFFSQGLPFLGFFALWYVAVTFTIVRLLKNTNIVWTFRRDGAANYTRTNCFCCATGRFHEFQGVHNFKTISETIKLKNRSFTAYAIQFETGDHMSYQLDPQFSRSDSDHAAVLDAFKSLYGVEKMAPPSGAMMTALAPGMAVMMVQVPPDMAAGQLIMVTSPTGSQMQVPLPAGLEPGQSFQVQYPVMQVAMPVAMPVAAGMMA